MELTKPIHLSLKYNHEKTQKNIILIYFNIKNTLKNNHNYTSKKLLVHHQTNLVSFSMTTGMTSKIVMP
jgi:hypothetical protein